MLVPLTKLVGDGSQRQDGPALEINIAAGQQQSLSRQGEGAELDEGQAA